MFNTFFNASVVGNMIGPSHKQDTPMLFAVAPEAYVTFPWFLIHGLKQSFLVLFRSCVLLLCSFFFFGGNGGFQFLFSPDAKAVCQISKPEPKASYDEGLEAFELEAKAELQKEAGSMLGRGASVDLGPGIDPPIEIGQLDGLCW